MSLRLLPRLQASTSPLLSRTRTLRTTSNLRTSTGYGDPPDEKANNITPTPSSTPDPKSGGSTSTTDPEVGEGGNSNVKAGEATNKGGKEGGSGASGDGEISGKQIRETKKIGEDPKEEEVGGAGVIGG